MVRVRTWEVLKLTLEEKLVVTVSFLFVCLICWYPCVVRHLRIYLYRVMEVRRVGLFLPRHVLRLEEILLFAHVLRWFDSKSSLGLFFGCSSFGEFSRRFDNFACVDLVETS